MDSPVGTRGIRDYDDGEAKVFVGSGRIRGQWGERGCRMRGRGTAVQIEDRQTGAGRKQSSISDSYGKKGFLKFLQEAAISVQTGTTDPEQLLATLEDEYVQTDS